MQMSDERKAKNESVFRDANEDIRDVQERLDLPEGRMPFICECEDEACRAVVQLTPRQYEEVRASPVRFLIADGHAAGEQASVVARGDGWCAIDKGGEGAEVARATDPRGEER